MPSKFAAMAAAASAVVDDTFGEEFDYRPYVAADPNAQAIPDGSRAVTRIVASWGAPFARGYSGPSRHPSVEITRAAHSTSRPSVIFSLSQLPYEVRQNDRLQRVDGGEVFIIAELRRAGNGRVAADLNVAG